MRKALLSRCPRYGRERNRCETWLRHAAALALVGWYLMTPLIDHEHGQIIYSAPLAYWQIEDSFDTAAECRRGRDSNIQFQMRLAKTHHETEAQEERYEAETDARMKWPSGTAKKSRGFGLQADMFAQCIASDDPRLKEK